VVGLAILSIFVTRESSPDRTLAPVTGAPQATSSSRPFSPLGFASHAHEVRAEAQECCPKNALIQASSRGGSLSGEAAELGEPGGQGRDRTADLAVFSRVRPIRIRPA
jgi:hypothetical protein